MFFLTGTFVTRFPASARRIAAAGFQIGDHTITPPPSGSAVIADGVMGQAR